MATIGAPPRHHGLRPARLLEGNGFFGFERFLVDVETKPDDVYRVDVIGLWLEERFQRVLIDLAKGEVVPQHGRNQVD